MPCSGRKHKPKYIISCKICNNEFKACVPFAKYCSKKCKRRASYLYTEKYIPHPYPEFIVQCSYCHKSIRKLPSSLKHSKSGKLYCNKSCKARAEITKLKTILFCNTCNKQIERSPSGIGIHNFCSRKCCNIWKRQFTKEQTPNWKGGYNKTERERIRSRIFWKELRAKVINSFENKCAQCNIDTTLHIHHIIPYRLGGLDELNNLIPLCPVCHSKQTVKDWENEHNLSWKNAGAHIHKGDDENGRTVQL